MLHVHNTEVHLFFFFFAQSNPFVFLLWLKVAWGTKLLAFSLRRIFLSTHTHTIRLRIHICSELLLWMAPNSVLCTELLIWNHEPLFWIYWTAFWNYWIAFLNLFELSLSVLLNLFEFMFLSWQLLSNCRCEAVKHKTIMFWYQIRSNHVQQLIQGQLIYTISSRNM